MGQHGTHLLSTFASKLPKLFKPSFISTTNSGGSEYVESRNSKIVSLMRMYTHTHMHCTAVGAIQRSLSFHYLVPFSLAAVYLLTTAIGTVFFLEPSAAAPSIDSLVAAWQH